MVEENDEIVISTQAAAKRCFVSARTIRNWIQQHELNAFQTVGGQYKIRLKDLKEFVRKNNMLMQNMNDKDIKKRILCVDDTPDILDVLTINLTAMNFVVETAKNGLEAGTKAITFKPDLIILDIMMPEMDGYETIRFFKGQKETKDIPIIALTSLTKLKDIERIYQAGADAYTAKPVKMSELQAMIKQALSIK